MKKTQGIPSICAQVDLVKGNIAVEKAGSADKILTKRVTREINGH